MNSPRRRQDRPIESVSLKITFRGRRGELEKIREAIPSVVVRGGTCEISIESGEPSEVVEEARSIMAKLRSAAELERL